MDQKAKTEQLAVLDLQAKLALLVQLDYLDQKDQNQFLVVQADQDLFDQYYHPHHRPLSYRNAS